LGDWKKFKHVSQMNNKRLVGWWLMRENMWIFSHEEVFLSYENNFFSRSGSKLTIGRTFRDKIYLWLIFLWPYNKRVIIFSVLIYIPKNNKIIHEINTPLKIYKSINMNFFSLNRRKKSIVVCIFTWLKHLLYVKLMYCFF